MEEKEKVDEISHKKSHKRLGQSIGIGILVYALGIAFGLCLHSCVSSEVKAQDNNAAQIIKTPLYASVYGEVDFDYATPITYNSLGIGSSFIAYACNLDLHCTLLQDSRIRVNSYDLNFYDSSLDLVEEVDLLSSTSQKVILEDSSYITCGGAVNLMNDYVLIQTRLSGYPSEYYNINIQSSGIYDFFDDYYFDDIFHFEDSSDYKPIWTLRIDNILELINEQVQFGYQYENGRREVQDNPEDYGLYTGSEYEQNYQNGYQVGYLAGEQQATDFSFGTLLASVFSAPITMFQNAFNFEFFGINMSALIGFLLSIGLVIFVISVFKKN